MEKLFERIIEVKVGDTLINGLDIAFEIEMDLEPGPNPCHIEIFNLGEANRNILTNAKKAPVLLKAGYKNQVGVIFEGDMISCRHEKSDTSWKTVLTNGDGAVALQTSRLKKSFAKGTPIKTIVDELIKNLSFPCAKNSQQNLNLVKGELKKGYCANSCTIDELNTLLINFQLKASVQNRALQIVKINTRADGKAINLNSNSGLKNLPQPNSDKTLMVNSVLMAELVPTSIIHVESSTFTGFATIQKVRFTGDNFGGCWDAEMECLAS